MLPEKCDDCGGIADQPDDLYYGEWCSRCTIMYLGAEDNSTQKAVDIWNSLPNAVEYGLPDEEETNVIVVKVYMWPLGRQESEYELGRAYITNDGSGTRTSGNYSFDIFGRGGRKLKGGEGRIEGFERRKYLSWELLYRVLNSFHLAREK